MDERYLKNIVSKLASLGERQFAQEIKARKLIESELSKLKLHYKIQAFETFIPLVKRAALRLDGLSIPALASSFRSGKIINNYATLSSLTSSQKFLYEPNINFNPRSEAISRSNHYFAPALAIRRQDVVKLVNAERILGEVRVQKKKHMSANILVGNAIRPEHLIFCHYDSISTGAIDDASGVALTLGALAYVSKVLERSLFVIAGNEELSYDEPVYWGHGYRAFEKKYSTLLSRAKNIIVLDCIGQGHTQMLHSSPIIMLGFPIRSIEKFSPKIIMLTGEFDKLMSVYHTPLDTPDRIDYQELVRAGYKLLKLLK